MTMPTPTSHSLEWLVLMLALIAIPFFIMPFLLPLVEWVERHTLQRLRSKRRAKASLRSVPVKFINQLIQGFDFLDNISDEERERFFKCAFVFYEEKNWAGSVSEEMKITISGCAAQLARNLPLDSFDCVSKITVYPGAFIGRSSFFGIKKARMDKGLVNLGKGGRFHIHLSWKHVLSGKHKAEKNVAIREFSRALDLQNHRWSLLPLLESKFKARTDVFQKHHDRCGSIAYGTLYAYQSSDASEFFVRTTETFLERPETLRKSSPDLFAEFSEFYRIGELSVV